MIVKNKLNICRISYILIDKVVAVRITIPDWLWLLHIFNLNSEFLQELVEDPLIIDKMRKRVGFNNSQQFQV